MAQWYLVAPSGAIVRSADADSLGEARFRLAPILPNHSVLSAASYADQPVTEGKGKGKVTYNAREISAQQRLAIARGNTRRMLARKYGWAPNAKNKRNPEVRSRTNKAYRAKQLEADPQYDAKLREARRREAVVRYASLLPDILRGIERGESDATLADRLLVTDDVIRDTREGFGLPCGRTMRRRRVTALAQYYRSIGWSDTTIAAHTGASRKMLRTIPRT